MSYNIQLTNGNILTTVPDTQLVSTYGGIDLIGHMYPQFGTILNNDLVHIVENFSDSTPPTNPLVGQLWYDTVSQSLNFWTGQNFNPISVITNSSTAPINPQEGDEWYDNANQQLYIWNGYEWILIGPANQSNTKEGFVVTSYQPEFGTTIYYLNLYANNQLIGIVSSISIVNPSIDGFGNIRPGINFVTNPGSAPSIVESGIYNVNIITLGNSDQITIVPDSYNNGLFATNGKNTFITTNGNLTANSAAFNELSSGNVTGTLIVNQIVANSYMNLPTLTVPGISGDFIVNYNGNLGASPSLILASGVPTANNFNVNGTITTTDLTVTNSLSTAILSATNSTLQNLIVTSNETVDGILQVNNSINSPTIGVTNLTATNETVNNLNVDGNASVTGNMSASIVYATTYENLPISAPPGSSGEVIYNNGGALGATPDLTISGGSVVASSITIQNALLVDGTTTLNAGTSGSFVMPTTRGAVPNAALLTNAGGGTIWGNFDLSQFGNNSLATNGFQVFPGGLILQWGTGPTIGQGTSYTVSYPNTSIFKSIFGVLVTAQYVPGQNTSVFSVLNNSITTSNFEVASSAGSGYAPFNWIAIGM